MTTNITELAQSLKAAAEKAGIEEWVNNRGEVNTADYEVDGSTYIDHICDCEIVGTESPRGEFIALANPANVLALVEALDKSEKTSEARREAIDRTHNMFVRERDRANAAEEALEKAQAKNALVAGGIEAATKLHERIAELDAELEREREKSRRVMSRIAVLESKLAIPVQLPKTNGYWTEQEKAYEEAITLAKRQIRLAGFRCEEDE